MRGVSKSKSQEGDGRYRQVLRPQIVMDSYAVELCTRRKATEQPPRLEQRRHRRRACQAGPHCTHPTARRGGRAATASGVSSGFFVGGIMQRLGWSSAHRKSDGNVIGDVEGGGRRTARGRS